MKHSEWLIVSARVGELWPNQLWPQSTMASAYDLFAKVDQTPALKAVAELAAEGREFAPAPGVVLARALAIVVASTPALPDPDLIRDLTPEEQDRARRMAAALAGTKADLVVATWMEFATHANGCHKHCAHVAARCRRPGLQASMYPPMLEELCADGRPFFEKWRYAVDEMRMTPGGVVQQEIPV